LAPSLPEANGQIAAPQATTAFWGTHLAWNYCGSGGNLRIPTINHLAHLLISSRAQVCFLSETRNSFITKTAIKNRFNDHDAFVVHAQGQSGGLRLIWTNDVDINIVHHSHYFIFALCSNKTTSEEYGLVSSPNHDNYMVTFLCFVWGT
jgi:hypothetical protein